MRFLTKRFPNSNDIHSNPGRRHKKVYAPHYDGKKLNLVESGTIDVQAEINSHCMECDINYILTRLGRGDMSVLNGNKPIYADFKDMPANFRDAFDIAFNAERIFNQLDREIKEKFDNDYRQFIYSIGTEEFNQIMGLTQQDPAAGSSGAPDPGSSGAPDPGSSGSLV